MPACQHVPRARRRQLILLTSTDNESQLEFLNLKSPLQDKGIYHEEDSQQLS